MVCRNAADQLDTCLRTMRWADELLVINMQSTDNTLQIASRWADRIISQLDNQPLPMVWATALAEARHPWVLLADPHDRMPESLARELKVTLSFMQTTAVVQVPRRFYLKNKALLETPWGYTRMTHLSVAHRDRCRVEPAAHWFFVPHDGLSIDAPHALAWHPVQHVWCQSKAQCLPKCVSMIPDDALSRYHAGHRFTLKDITTTPLTGLLRTARHLLHPRQMLWDIAGILFNAASSVMLLRHQMIKTPRYQAVQHNQAQRQAA